MFVEGVKREHFPLAGRDFLPDDFDGADIFTFYRDGEPIGIVGYKALDHYGSCEVQLYIEPRHRNRWGNKSFGKTFTVCRLTNWVIKEW